MLPEDLHHSQHASACTDGFCTVRGGRTFTHDRVYPPLNSLPPLAHLPTPCPEPSVRIMRFLLLLLVLCGSVAGCSSAVVLLGQPQSVRTTQLGTGDVSIRSVAVHVSGFGSLLLNAVSSSGSVVSTLLQRVAARIEFNWTFSTPNACAAIKMVALRGLLLVESMNIYTEGQLRCTPHK